MTPHTLLCSFAYFFFFSARNASALLRPLDSSSGSITSSCKNSLYPHAPHPPQSCFHILCGDGSVVTTIRLYVTIYYSGPIGSSLMAANALRML